MHTPLSGDSIGYRATWCQYAAPSFLCKSGLEPIQLPEPATNVINIATEFVSVHVTLPASCGAPKGLNVTRCQRFEDNDSYFFALRKVDPIERLQESISDAGANNSADSCPWLFIITHPTFHLGSSIEVLLHWSNDVGFTVIHSTFTDWIRKAY